MNATFKVVFNKARGALMVVNEMTSSVQKKGTKTVVAAAVACLASGAAFAAVNPADAQYANAGAFVTWNGEAPSVPDANPIEMTGAQAQAIGGSGKNWVSVVKSSVGATGTMNNLDINLTAQGPNATPNQDKQLILVHSQGGGSILVAISSMSLQQPILLAAATISWLESTVRPTLEIP
ncbi:ESPR domain-containing protein [Duodenibacillus massiliensis]|jgi:hypothetical protein|uniref:ESPR domain-containing protein n=1 Tax=Duodenibacillus massiliensis TaxID=1852381 RepID=UPI003F7CFC40